jgi:pyruvate dehydrogenase phosphatase
VRAEAASGPRGVTEGAIRDAFAATEGAFIAEVASEFDDHPDVATVGSCCLVGVVHDRTLFVTNLGDSRAVLGKRVGRGAGQIVAEQLSSEHNANMEAVRQELVALHPDDPQIVALKHGVWRVKGIIQVAFMFYIERFEFMSLCLKHVCSVELIPSGGWLLQVSRSLGDAYLKDAKFNTEQIKPKFRVAEPFSRPIMSADPSIVSRSLQPSDCFVIFASDGLWEHLSNQEAVEIVHNNPRAVRSHTPYSSLHISFCYFLR